MLNQPSMSVGSVATYSCDTGFEISSSPTRTCGSTGAWSGVAPTCDREEDSDISVFPGIM